MKLGISPDGFKRIAQYDREPSINDALHRLNNVYDTLEDIFNILTELNVSAEVIDKFTEANAIIYDTIQAVNESQE